MPRLPDIPIDDWWNDQQKRFQEATAGLLPALDFEIGAREQEAQIPPDYDAPGGMDQWKDAEQSMIERESRLAQQQDEERRRQEIEQQAEQYRQQQVQAEAQQQAEQQQREASVMDTIRGLGIPTPSEAFANLSIGDNQSTTGIFDAREQDTGPHEQPYPGTVTPIRNPDGSITTERSLTVTEPDLNEGRPTNIPSVWSGRIVDDDEAIENAIYSRRQFPSYGSIDEAETAARQRSDDLGRRLQETPPSDVDAFNQFAGGLIDNPSQAPTPDPTQNRDNESTTGIFDRIGSAVRSVMGPSLQEQVERPDRTPEQESLARMDEMYGGLGQGPRWLSENVGAGKLLRDTEEQDRILQEARQFDQERGAEPDLRTQVMSPLSPDYRAANPEKATRFDEAEQAWQDIAMGASGTMGGAGMADDAINAIKTLLSHGLDDAALAGERSLAEKSSMTLAEIQQRTRGSFARGLVEGTPEYDEALRAHEERTPEYGPRSVGARAPEGASGTSVPESSIGFSPLQAFPSPETPAIESGGRIPWTESRREASEQARSLLGESRPLNREERARAAAEMYQTSPEKIEEAFQEAMRADPVNRGVMQEALHQRAQRKWEAWDEARQEWLDAKNELDTWRTQNPGANPSNLDDDVANRLAYWWGEMQARGLEMFPAIIAPTRVARAASKELNAQQLGRLGAVQVAEGRQLRGVAETIGEAAEAAGKAAREGIIDDDVLTKLGKAGTVLESEKNVKAITRRSRTARRIEEGAPEAGSGSGGRGGRGTGTNGAAAGSPRPPRPPQDETLAERLGRLKREQGRFESMLDEPAGGRALSSGRTGTVDIEQKPPFDPAVRKQIEDQLTLVRQEIDETLTQAKEEAAELVARQFQGRLQRPRSEVDLDRIADEAVGRRALNKIRREEVRKQKGLTGYEGQINKDVQRAIDKYYQDEQRLMTSIDRQMQRRIDGALAAERRKETREEVRTMAREAQILMRELRRKATSLDSGASQHNEEQFDLVMRRMEDHSNIGKRVAGEMRDRLWDQLGREVTRRGEQDYQAGQRAIDEARIRAVKQQIKDVLANPHAEGSHTRIAELYQDLAAINEYGVKESSRMARQAHEAGILKSGLFADDMSSADKDKLVELMSMVDPTKPETFRPLQELMVRPNLWQLGREISFINMLSQPVTLATNLTSTGANIVLKGVVRGALEQMLSGGQLSGTGAFIEGLGRGAGRGARRAQEIMSTGLDPERLEDLVGRGEFRRVGREVVPQYLEKAAGTPGRKWGELMHQISTRPQAATDAFLGSMAYAGAFAREATRHVDDLIRRKSPELRSMEPVGDWAGKSQRERAVAYIHQNPWDFPDLIKQAGKIEDYTLFRTKGKSWGETELRGLMGLKEVPLNAPTWQHALAGFFDFLMPFWNVPYNFTKQGAGNVAAPIQGIRALKAYASGDVKGGAEKMAHAIQGGAMLTIPYFLAREDMLTGAGPRDPGQRRVWEENHKPNSWYAPGYGWVSYEGTPWAMPFAVMAGIKEGYEFGDIKPDDPIEKQLGMGFLLAAQGGLRGAVSQSFVDATMRNLSTLTGDTAGTISSQALASLGSSTASRYLPTPIPAGTLNFLGQMYDHVQREAGRAREFEDIGEVAQNQFKSRLPILREDLPAKRGAYGEVLPNERRGVAFMPRSIMPERAPNQNDPITGMLEEADVGIPTAPKEISMDRGTAPITIAEQQEYQRVYGEKFREYLERARANSIRNNLPLTDRDLLYLRTAAREAAQDHVVGMIGPTEFRRRWSQKTPVEVTP